MKTCKITFRTSEGLRFIKGQQYNVLKQVGLENIKLFKIYNENGSFTTDENHLNKFFI